VFRLIRLMSSSLSLTSSTSGTGLFRLRRSEHNQKSRTPSLKSERI
jgi:hypothetical protein